MNTSLFRKRVLVTLTTCLLALTGLCACTSASTNAGSTSTATGSATTAATTSSCKHSYGYMGFDAVPDNDDLALIASKHYYAEYTEYIEYATDTENTESETAEIKEAYDLNDSLIQTYSAEGTLTGAYANLGGMVTYANYASGIGYEADYSADYDADRESIKDVIAANEAPTDGLVYSETVEEAVPYTGDDTTYTCYVFTLSSVSVGEDGSETPYTNTYKLYVDGTKLHAQYIEYADNYATTKVFKTITGDIPEDFMTSPDTSGLEMSDYESVYGYGSETETE